MDSKIKIMGYAVLGLYFVGMLAIGYFCNKKYAFDKEALTELLKEASSENG